MQISSQTIADRLEAVNSRPSGFDYIRIVLAISVIFAHSTLQKELENETVAQTFGLYTTLIVPMFFALSGFLVAGSLERCKSLVTFLGLRVFRIIPALAVEVILSALVLGPIFTILPLAEYFSSPVFHKYLLNIAGHIHYYLPGVFENNKSTQVNGQLWTVPWELACYLVLALIVILGGYKFKRGLTYVLILGYLVELFQYFYSNQSTNVATGQITVLCFLSGIWVYRNRGGIPYFRKMFVIALVLSVFLEFVPNGIRFIPIPVAYMTIFLGLLNPRRNETLLGGDYSYGIYLYGYVVQQAIFAISPIFDVWYLNLLVSLPLVIIIAYASWHLVELPVLQKKGILKRMEDAFMNRREVRDSKTIQSLSGISNMAISGRLRLAKN
jgi:peptidoglycan/LPS O-acetylase OafA/YrhL